MIDDDLRIVRRLRPFVDAALDDQAEPAKSVLSNAISHGDLALSYSDGPAGELMIDLHAAGYHFVSVAAGEVGVCQCSLGGIHYHRDPILDDDLPGD